MKSRIPRLAAATALLLALALPAAAQAAAPSYYPSGPQQDVARASVTDAGWTVCYSGDYTNSSDSVASILAARDQDYLMLAAGATGGNDKLLAAAPRGDVLYDAGQSRTDSQLSNGSQWYFSDSYSWGFAKGDSIDRLSCDWGDNTHPELRFCWHTSGGELEIGYRAGEFDYALYVGGWDRVVLEHTGAVATGSPNPLDFGAQARDTVSSVRTVTFTLNGAPLDPLGSLDVAGANADDFWLVSHNCPSYVTATGDTCTAGTNGVDGTNGANGTNGAKGDKGDRLVRAARTTVRCGTKRYGGGARMVCRFSRRSGRNSLVQLRDRRGALSTARGNGKRTMVFLSRRKPRGTVYAFVIKGLRTS